VIDVLIEAIDDCIARVKKGRRHLKAQDWIIFIGATAMLVALFAVVLGLWLV
jgi:hypothetical protein